MRPVRPLRTRTTITRRRLRTAIRRANKETSVDTLVSIMLALAGVAVHIFCMGMEKGIRSPPFRSAIIADPLKVFHVAIMLLLPIANTQKICPKRTKKGATDIASATSLKLSVSHFIACSQDTLPAVCLSTPIRRPHQGCEEYL